MSDLWTLASEDVEAEAQQRKLATARLALVELWPFLAASVSEGDFANRVALVADRIDVACPTPELRVQVVASLKADVAILHNAASIGDRSTCSECGNAIVVKHDETGQRDLGDRNPHGNTGNAWAEVDGFEDDRDFQCGVSEDHLHHPSGRTGVKTAAFEHTHTYDPIGWDRFDAKPLPGHKAIKPGSKVRKLDDVGDPMGKFVYVEDEAGNRQSVDRKSLKRSKGSKTASQMSLIVKADDEEVVRVRSRAIPWGEGHQADGHRLRPVRRQRLGRCGIAGAANDWMMEGGNEAPYPVGSLLYWTENPSGGFTGSNLGVPVAGVRPFRHRRGRGLGRLRRGLFRFGVHRFPGGYKSGDQANRRGSSPYRGGCRSGAPPDRCGKPSTRSSRRTKR
jgi:hypothetical protein